MIETLRKDWPSLDAHIELAQSLFGAGGPERVRAWFAAQLDRVTDPDFAQLFAEHIALPGVAEADFNHRIVERGGLRLLGGIRFFGGDAARPFVEAIAWAQGLMAIEQAEEYALGATSLEDVYIRLTGDVTTMGHDR